MSISIDQNSHSLWDVVPKLQALAASNLNTTHFIEDIDVAFTAIGSLPGDAKLTLARERYYRSGGMDWGAAMFYSEFLGKLPIDITDFESMTGMKTSTLAKKLATSADDLYDEYSPGDNWQLIGSSYAGNRKQHRTIADLTVAETANHIREMFDIAGKDMLDTFIQKQSRQRIESWLASEKAFVESLIATFAGARLVDLYAAWMARSLPETCKLGITSNLFACDNPRWPGRELFDLFLKDYDQLAALYNQAIAETDSNIKPLATKRGDLPFFASSCSNGTMVRSPVNYIDGKLIIAGISGTSSISGIEIKTGSDARQTLANLATSGVKSLSGKAVIMVIQVRLGDTGSALALPYQGSLYTPTAHCFANKLISAGLLKSKPMPILRVRFHLLDQMKSLDTIIRLPKYLARAMGKDEITARELSENYRDLSNVSQARLGRFEDKTFRDEWMNNSCPVISAKINTLDAERLAIVKENAKDPRARDIWKQIRLLRQRQLKNLLDTIAADTHISNIEYWDSRGAILPWCIALGGDAFYNKVITEAEIYEE